MGVGIDVSSDEHGTNGKKGYLLMDRLENAVSPFGITRIRPASSPSINDETDNRQRQSRVQSNHDDPPRVHKFSELREEGFIRYMW